MVTLKTDSVVRNLPKPSCLRSTVTIVTTKCLQFFTFGFPPGDDGVVGSSRLPGGRETEAASSGEVLQAEEEEL